MFRRKQDFLEEKLEDGHTLLYLTQSKKSLILNSEALFLLNHCEGKEKDEIVSDYIQKFETMTNDHLLLRNDAEAALIQLIEFGIIQDEHCR